MCVKLCPMYGDDVSGIDNKSFTCVLLLLTQSVENGGVLVTSGLGEQGLISH